MREQHAVTFNNNVRAEMPHIKVSCIPVSKASKNVPVQEAAIVKNIIPNKAMMQIAVLLCIEGMDCDA